ncbi:MAG: putative quinol monooxygenase [Cellulophaga sp.]|uniref:putative quinol monooxygenase n=1 Tax=unclassified Cellulophaga TaxID=2634405 RepID=UPI000C2CAF32|nr:putative quinol monooxygenase [Cellulophaga sp. RHA19]PKB42539.1 quinol monooxygenase YgiN [Cellulophaga sp. RHA19]
MKIYVTAIIKSKPEFTEEVKAALQNMVVETLKEEACIKYDLQQSLTDNNTFIFHEIWKNEAGLDLHGQQPHIAKFKVLAATKLNEKPVVIRTKLI